MNKKEALEILNAELGQYKKQLFSELRVFIGTGPKKKQIRTPKGITYNIEIIIFWDDDKLKKNVRVSGAIDSGGWRSYFPLTVSFTTAPLI